MSRRPPLRSGAELDVHYHRHDLVWRRDEVAWLKRQTRRRERHDARAELHAEARQAQLDRDQQLDQALGAARDAVRGLRTARDAPAHTRGDQHHLDHDSYTAIEQGA